MPNLIVRGTAAIYEGDRCVAVVDNPEEAELICALVNYDRELKDCIGKGILDHEIKIGGSE